MSSWLQVSQRCALMGQMFIPLGGLNALYFRSVGFWQAVNETHYPR